MWRLPFQTLPCSSCVNITTAELSLPGAERKSGVHNKGIAMRSRFAILAVDGLHRIHAIDRRERWSAPEAKPETETVGKTRGRGFVECCRAQETTRGSGC